MRVLMAVAALTMGLVVGCNDTATAPKLEEWLVGPPTGMALNHGFTAIAISFQGSQELFLQVETVNKSTNVSVGTSLRFLRTLWQDGTVLEDFTVQIPSSDFTGGTRTADWSLHTNISGHGQVDVTWANTGVWARQLPHTAPVPGTNEVLRVAGTYVLQEPDAGTVSGSIFGQAIGLDPVHGDAFGVLVLDRDVVISVQQR